jgi:hypothetical protein
MESQVFKDLVTKINSIAKFVIEHRKNEDEKDVTEGWVDSYEVCSFLKISTRTLQRLRSSKTVSYSRIGGKNYYKLSEVSRLLNEHIIRSSEERLQDLIKNHQSHVEQRRNTKTDK